MKYLIAYLKALLNLATWGGALFLLVTVINHSSVLADYIAYVCVLAALAGPIGVLTESIDQ